MYVQNVIEATCNNYPLYTGARIRVERAPDGDLGFCGHMVSPCLTATKKRYRNGDRSWECRRAIYQGLNCPVAASMSYQRGSVPPCLTDWMVGWSVGRLADWCAYGVAFNRGAGIS